MIISPPFVEAATALARTLRPQLSALFEAAEPPLPGFATEAERWFALCETDPEAAFAEAELEGILAVLVSVMHARSVFALAERRRYGARPEVEVAGDLGGAVLAQVARNDILRLARRRDRERAARLSRNVLRLIEQQRAEIAELAARRF